MPHPNNKLQFIIDYISDNKKEIKIKEFDCDFPNIIHKFNGFYFQIIFGQDTINKIYEIKTKKLILVI